MPDELEERGRAPGEERAEALQVTTDAVAPHDRKGVQQDVLAGDQSLDHRPTPSANGQSTSRATRVPPPFRDSSSDPPCRNPAVAVLQSDNDGRCSPAVTASNAAARTLCASSTLGYTPSPPAAEVSLMPPHRNDRLWRAFAQCLSGSAGSRVGHLRLLPAGAQSRYHRVSELDDYRSGVTPEEVRVRSFAAWQLDGGA